MPATVGLWDGTSSRSNNCCDCILKGTCKALQFASNDTCRQNVITNKEEIMLQEEKSYIVELALGNAKSQNQT